MKLLILTQILDKDDSNLGFFHRWVEEFAKHCERVTVICLREGHHTLPEHVVVRSLGKESGTSRIARAMRFLKYIRQSKNDYDAVFVHMNPEYIVLGGPFWKRWGKKISLWYAHRSVTWKLRRAVKLADIIFSVSSTSFGIATPKLKAMGHGIDTELFKPAMREESTKLRLITTGRIAASKRLLEMLEVLDELSAMGRSFIFTIVGEPVTDVERAYAVKLRDAVEERPYHDSVRFLGAVRHEGIPTLLHEHDLFFNFATTGNMDKAGLEALAAGLPLFSTNKAFEELLLPWGLYLDSMDPEHIAHAVDEFMGRNDKAAALATLRHRVIEEHSLEKLIPKIVQQLQ